MTLEKMDDSTDRMNVSNENIQIDERGIELADIDIRNLTKKYSTLKAVDALSFKAYRGNVSFSLFIICCYFFSWIEMDNPYFSNIGHCSSRA